MNWKPVFDINDKKEIENKIDDITKSLFEVKFNKLDIGLFSGISGISLFFFYLAKYKSSNYYYEFGYNLIEKVIDTISEKDIPTNFVDGLAGVGWTIQHLYKNSFLEGSSDNLLNELDEYIIEYINNITKNDDFDLLYGVIGYTNYLIARDKINENLLTKLLNYFIETSIVFSKTEQSWECFYANKKVINFGLAHGVSSIIVILIKLIKKSNVYDEHKNLIYNAINYLLNNKNNNYKAIGSFFPTNVGEEKLKSRFIWCHGDIGPATALLRSAQCFNNEELFTIVEQIMKFSSQRKDMEENGIYDALICHGTAGVAHWFNRYYNYSKNEEYRESAIYWFLKTIEIGNHKNAPAGYKFITEGGEWVEEFSLLSGISGIGLSLISAVSEIEPKWDEALLLS